jgi:CRP/FNR family transcriptional regulator
MRVIDLTKVKVSCENCGLNELCLPRGLNRTDLEKLDQVARRTRPLQKGDVLFRSGDDFHSLYAVRSGCLKLHATSDLGEEQIIGFYLPGEIVGLDGVDSDTHSCSATALETSSLCGFPYASLVDICRRVPALNDQMLRLMGRELSQDNQLLLTITKKNAEERIATFLLSLSLRFKRLGYSSSEFKLSMSRSEMGNYLGLTIETVSRGMSKFQKQGWISIERKFVKILDMPALQSLCTQSGNQADETDSVVS